MPIFAGKSRATLKTKCLNPAHLAAAKAIEPMVRDELPKGEADLLIRIFTAVSEMAEQQGGDGRVVMKILTTFITHTAIEAAFKKNYGAKTLLALKEGSPSTWALMARTMPAEELERRLENARLALVSS